MRISPPIWVDPRNYIWPVSSWAMLPGQIGNLDLSVKLSKLEALSISSDGSEIRRSPVEVGSVSPLFARLYIYICICQVVQDFFHQQYQVMEFH